MVYRRFRRSDGGVYRDYSHAKSGPNRRGGGPHRAAEKGVSLKLLHDSPLTVISF